MNGKLKLNLIFNLFFKFKLKIKFKFKFIPTTFMLRVSFSPAPECVEADCWNRAFPTPPCHQRL